MQPWGDIRKILIFWLILKKISKIRVAFQTKFLYGRVVGYETSFSTVCPTYRSKLVFIEFQSINVRIYCFYTHFFDFGGHFGMKNVIDLHFFIFFLNLREISFKIVLLTSYLSFNLNSGKIFFCCRFYQIFFVYLFFLRRLFSFIPNMVKLFRKNNFS